MISFKDLLNEGRDAPLYHGTDSYAAASICYTNKMTSNDRWGTHWHVAFSRSKKFAFRFPIWAGTGKSVMNPDDLIVFEFDQRKLAQRYKIIPFNHPFSMDPTWADTRGPDEWSEFEERVYTKNGIKNVNQFITKIYVKDYAKLKKIADRSPHDKMYNALLQNWKLYDLKTNSFVNSISKKPSKSDILKDKNKKFHKPMSIEYG